MLRNYLVGSIAYGFVRKVDELTNARVKATQYKLNEDCEFVPNGHKMVPMLLVHRFTALAISTVASPCLLPLYVYKDLLWLELSVRHLDPHDCYIREKMKTSWIEYLF